MIRLLLLVQVAGWTAAPAAPTVGDTVRLTRRIVLPAGAQPRVVPLTASGRIEPLAPPEVRRGEGYVEVVYRIAPFATGRYAVVLPDVDIVLPDGRTETLRGDSVIVSVASVHPAGETIPAPLPSRGPLARPARAPQAVLGAVLAVVLGAVTWGAWRRRVRPRPPRRRHADPAAAPVDRWAAAGELRAVATSAADRLRAAIAERVPGAGRHLDVEACLAALERDRPEWPLRDLGNVLRALERARFAPAVPGDVVLLVDEAATVLAALEDDSGESAP